MCEIFPILRILVLHSLHCCLVCGSIVNSRTWDFSHQIDLKDLHGIHIQWRHFQARSNATGYKHVEQWIEIKVTGRTTGYVGVGFSPNGGMSGADMAIGWIDQNGHSHLRVTQFVTIDFKCSRLKCISFFCAGLLRRVEWNANRRRKSRLCFPQCVRTWRMDNDTL